MMSVDLFSHRVSHSCPTLGLHGRAAARMKVLHSRVDLGFKEPTLQSECCQKMLSFWARKAERREQSPQAPVGLEMPQEEAEEREAIASQAGDPGEPCRLWGDRRVSHSWKDSYLSLMKDG